MRSSLSISKILWKLIKWCEQFSCYQEITAKTKAQLVKCVNECLSVRLFIISNNKHSYCWSSFIAHLKIYINWISYFKVICNINIHRNYKQCLFLLLKISFNLTRTGKHAVRVFICFNFMVIIQSVSWCQNPALTWKKYIYTCIHI